MESLEEILYYLRKREYAAWYYKTTVKVTRKYGKHKGKTKVIRTLEQAKEFIKQDIGQLN